uniref:(northern house mosquito) hypothetical protein n=1 Tax=Culex pipiens TaxID=7175 RepID=A0A8D8A7S8_CULPI
MLVKFGHFGMPFHDRTQIGILVRGVLQGRGSSLPVPSDFLQQHRMVLEVLLQLVIVHVIPQLQIVHQCQWPLLHRDLIQTTARFVQLRGRWDRSVRVVEEHPVRISVQLFVRPVLFRRYG